MAVPNDRAALAELLADAGFVAADEEADELLARAAGDVELLEGLVARRLTGEPLAWITGTVSFCGLEIRVDRGVYVPAGRASRSRVAPRSGCRRTAWPSTCAPEPERSPGP